MKKILSFGLSLILIILFFSINVFSNTEFGDAYYRVEENLATRELVNGASYSQDLSWTDINEDFSSEKKQLVSMIETPINDDIKVVTWATINGSRWVRSPVPTIARDYELKHPGYRVIAAVNGDFFDINGEENLPYTIEGSHVSGGNVYKKTNQNNVVGITNNGLEHLRGNEYPSFNEKMTITIYNENDEVVEDYQIDKVNEEVLVGEVGIYYANWNNEKKILPITAPKGFVVEEAEYALAYSNNDFYGKGIITNEIPKELGEGEFSIISKNEALTALLNIGTKIRVQYDLNGDWKNVDSITGVRRTLIYNDEYIDNTSDTARHPRTMIGLKADGKLLLAIADGRAPGEREGVTHQEMSTIMHHYGAVEAYNLDGGGSSTMVILENGKLTTVNSPSGGSILRPVSNALLVVVKVPEVNYQFILSKNSIVVNAEIIDDKGIEIDDLYFGVEDDIRKIENNKVLFEGLTSNTSYFYDFYRKVDDKYQSLKIQGIFTTTKETPIIKVLAYYEANDLIIKLDNIDDDQSIKRALIYLDGTARIPINNIVRINNYQGDINSLDVNIEIDLNDGGGRHPYSFNLNVYYDINALVNVISKKINNHINEIFE